MSQTQEKAPGDESKGLVNLDSRSLAEATDTRRTGYTGFRVDGALVIDLRVSGGPYGGNDHVVGRRIQSAAYAPIGADVTFIVSAKQFVPMDHIAYLRQHGAHLKTVRVQSDCPETISTWWSALRGEEF